MFSMKKLEGRREMFLFELDELIKSHGMLCICQVEEIQGVFDRKYTSFL